MAGELARLLGVGGIAAAGGLLTGEAYQRLGEIGEQARREAGELAQTQLGQTEFRPYTVTTGTGGSLQATPEGGLSCFNVYLKNKLCLSSCLVKQVKCLVNL
jgi:hypothetical protein